MANSAAADQDWPPPVLERVRELLCQAAGHTVQTGPPTAAASGWSPGTADFGWLRRVTVSDWPGVGSVVVKRRRPADHWRAGDTTAREHAALRLLADLGCGVGPKVIAVDAAAGLVVLEDLGAGPAVEDVLVAGDRSVALAGLHGHAVALAALQSAARGQSAEFARRLGQPENRDRAVVQIMPFARRWPQLQAIIDCRAELPATNRTERDVRALQGWLENPDLLGLSTGDFMPQNSRILPGGVRLLDFEDALFQHVLLDAAQLRIPYAAAPAWSRLPPAVTAAVEATYRRAIVQTFPELTEDAVYDRGMAMATCAWAVVRLTRLPALEVTDRPHPLGYSRRGQLLDLLRTAADSCATARTLPVLRGWFEDVLLALRRRWPEVAARQLDYPAFRTPA